jgi:hypothetical protein
MAEFTSRQLSRSMFRMRRLQVELELSQKLRHRQEPLFLSIPFQIQRLLLSIQNILIWTTLSIPSFLVRMVRRQQPQNRRAVPHFLSNCSTKVVALVFTCQRLAVLASLAFMPNDRDESGVSVSNMTVAKSLPTLVLASRVALSSELTWMTSLHNESPAPVASRRRRTKSTGSALYYSNCNLDYQLFNYSSSSKYVVFSRSILLKHPREERPEWGVCRQGKDRTSNRCEHDDCPDQRKRQLLRINGRVIPHNAPFLIFVSLVSPIVGVWVKCNAYQREEPLSGVG